MDSLKNALSQTFAEPQDVQRRRLASEFSTMKQQATEPIDRFAYRFKNNLHQLAKLGETVEENSPHFVMSHFISKTRSDIQRHLVLKAEDYKNLSDIIEAAKRIERSFNPVNSGATSSNNRLSSANSPKVLAAILPPKDATNATKWDTKNEIARQTVALRKYLAPARKKFVASGTITNGHCASWQTNL